MSFKLVTLNIEGNRHLPEVKAFLQREQPDIICLQEVFEVHVPELADALGMQPFYTPMSNVTTGSIHADPFGYWGLLQLVSPQCEIVEQKAEYYVGSRESIPIFFENENPNSINRAVLWSSIRKNGEELTVATTHFTWSPQGATTEEQLRDFAALQKITQALPPHVLCGDFNAPREREIFSTLSSIYQDNIPNEVTSTLDEHLHKAGKLEYVVDGYFSSPGIIVQDVRVVPGVSDHCAVVGEVLSQRK